MAAKSPQDHREPRRPFEVKVGTEVFELAVPNAGTMRKVRRLEPMDLMFTLFEECGTPEFLAALDELGTDELEPIFSDWMGSLGGAGKSGGSST